MTVCVAALYHGHRIVGASDRMITSGDVQFEPQQTKLVKLTSSIVAMLAGDSGLQVEIMYQVRDVINARVAQEPDNWWNVKDVADLYARFYNEARLKRAENSILAPLGLDHDTFISKQQEMAPQLVTQLATEMINFAPPAVSAIIAGVDTSGGHLYVVHGSDITCQDSVGFAAIGMGYWHANSQFMFAGHHRNKPFPETLLLVYSAKKRAEVAPGVGEATDMFFIEELGSYSPIGDHVLVKLEGIYQSAQEREKKNAEESEKSVNKYVQEIIDSATTQEQSALPENSGGDASSDQKELRDGAQESEPKGKPKPN